MSDDTKICPFCGEEIKANAIKCKHCGEFLNKPQAKTPEYRHKKTSNFWKLALIVFVCLVFLGIYFEDSENKNSESIENIQNEPRQESVVESNNEDIDSDDCVLKLGNTCYHAPFKLPESEAMTFMECMNEGGGLGIRECYFEKDIWAGIVRRCGGVQNLPSVEDLMALSNYLYGIKMEKCPFYGDENATYSDVVDCWSKYSDFPRNDDLDFVKMMKEMIFPYPPHDRISYEAQQNWGFSIWSSKEQSGYFGYAGSFGQKGTGISGDKYRNTDRIWGMCVSRD